jgi:hypothetical protein
MMRNVVTTAMAWLLGLVAYEAWLRIVWHQSMGGDWKAVVIWSALAFAVIAPILYFPAMRIVRARLGGYRPIAWFPLVAAALGVVPTAIIVLIWGGGLRGLLSPEASIFYVMFLIVGGVFGLGYAIRRPDAA